MLLSRMKKRMRFVKMLWLTILWHVTLNLRKRRRRDRKGRGQSRAFSGEGLREVFLSLVGVAEDEEGARLRHGHGLLLQLDVGQRTRPRAHWHLGLVVIFVP